MPTPEEYIEGAGAIGHGYLVRLHSLGRIKDPGFVKEVVRMDDIFKFTSTNGYVVYILAQKVVYYTMRLISHEEAYKYCILEEEVI